MNNTPVVYYDSECGLCNYSVQFIIKHDRKAIFRFAGLNTPQGMAARNYVTHNGLVPDSIIVFDGAKYLTKSNAVFYILKMLSKYKALLFLMKLTPLVLKDATYDVIARNRKLLFKRKSCMVLSPELQSRLFI